MASRPATPAMETTSNSNTCFHSTQKRIGPTAHLEVLRGDPNSIHLLTEDYMSPFLHNNSDTYHRHLGRLLQHGVELSQNLHNRQWIRNQAGRREFLRMTDHLGFYCAPFVLAENGAPKYARSREEKETKEEFWKREWAKKEENGMSRAGWNPESLREIKKAILAEELEEIESVKRCAKTNDTFATDNESVFDDEEEDDDDEDEDDEQDHLYTDCQPAGTATFIAHPVIRSDNNFPSAIERSLDRETSLLAEATESLEEFVRRSLVQSTGDPMASPSAILHKFAYKPGSDSEDDSDDESDTSDDTDTKDEAHWSPVSSLTPASPNSSCDEEEGCTVINSDIEPQLSVAQLRMTKFLADILAVRAQVEIEIQEDWDYKIWIKEEERKEANREGCKESWKLKRLLERYEKYCEKFREG